SARKEGPIIFVRQQQGAHIRRKRDRLPVEIQENAIGVHEVGDTAGTQRTWKGNWRSPGLAAGNHIGSGEIHPRAEFVARLSVRARLVSPLGDGDAVV